MNIYTVKSTDIVHNTSVDLITRWSTREVHIVQYDNSQPIVAVELFKNSERFVLPDGYEANLRFGKKDRTFIYKPVLGCNQGRDTVYFAVDEQMSMLYGKVTPIIELTYNGAVVGSSSIPFVIDRNPIQIGDVESKTDYPAIVERISASEAAVADAKKAVDAEAAERAAGDAKTLSDAKAYTDSSTSGLVSDSTTIKSNITTLQSDVASLKTDNIQNKTNISNKQDILVSGTNIKSINGQSLLGSGDMTAGLPKPWESGTMGGNTPYLGVHRVEGDIYSGFFEADGRALYGAFRDNCSAYYNAEINEDNPILFMAGKGDITSMVKLPSDFLTKSQEITLGSGLPSYVYTDNASADRKSGIILKENVIGVQALTSDKKYNSIALNVTEDFVFANFVDAKKNNALYIFPDGLSSDFVNTVSVPAKTGVMALTSDLDTKQDKLVSGMNIKTINGNSILGTGDITISGGGTNYITETTDTLVLKPVNTNGNDFEVRTKDNDVVVSFTQNSPGNSSSYDLFSVILSTATNEDGELYNIVARFTKDENWDAKLNIFANAGSSGASFDITIPPDAYGNIAMASDLEPLKTSIGNKQDTLVSGTNIKTINGESILGSGNIAISGGSGSGLAEPWSTDANFLGVWSKSSPNLSENDLFEGLHANDDLIGFEAVNFTSNKDAIIIPTLTSDVPLFQFMNLDGNIISMVKLPEDFFTRSQTINLGDIANIGGSGSGRPPLYSHTITLKGSGNSAYFTFTIYVRTDEEITKDTLFDYLNWEVCAGTGVASNALIDKITFNKRADSTWVHQFLELSGQHIDKEPSLESVFGTDFTVEDVVRGPDWVPPR